MLKIILGVCGGIAAYKAAYLASMMKKKAFEVKVVMTDSACKFITPLTFKTVTCNHVYTDLFDTVCVDNHTALSAWADLIIIAPATANTMAKIARGFADNLLTSVVLDYTGQVFIFPAMHENMWNNPATQNNVKELSDRKFHVFEPESGDLAGGKKGVGRMIEPENIMTKVLAILEKDYPAISEK